MTYMHSEVFSVVELTVDNPATGEQLCRYAGLFIPTHLHLLNAASVVSASERNVKATIENAHDVFQSGVWSRASHITRSEVLSRLAAALRKHIPDFARLET
jgi:acyl-CoA reductase-like NAD-dependent aldehyde dehydrogenase